MLPVRGLPDDRTWTPIPRPPARRHRRLRGHDPVLPRRLDHPHGDPQPACSLTGDRSIFEIALDTPDHEKIAPFWAAALGYEVDGDEVHGQAGIGPTLWFQHREPDDEQRFHLDVRVPHDIAAQRIQQVVDAGGTVVRDGSPAYVVLQDVDGNKACICTNLGREGWSAP